MFILGLHMTAVVFMAPNILLQLYATEYMQLLHGCNVLNQILDIITLATITYYLNMFLNTVTMNI